MAENIVAQTAPLVPPVETIKAKEEDPDQPGVMRDVEQQSPLSPLEWGEMVRREAIKQIDPNAPGAERLRAAVHRRVSKMVEERFQQEVKIAGAALAEQKQRFDQLLAANKFDASKHVEAHRLMMDIHGLLADAQAGIGSAQDIPPEVLAEYKTMARQMLDMLLRMQPKG
jgi:hypothetical protein